MAQEVPRRSKFPQTYPEFEKYPEIAAALETELMDMVPRLKEAAEKHDFRAIQTELGGWKFPREYKEYTSWKKEETRIADEFVKTMECLRDLQESNDFRALNRELEQWKFPQG